MSIFADIPPEPAAAALEYARRGLAVFPCSPHTKRPLTKHGFLDASSDPIVVANWWAQHPQALIGLPTGERNGLWGLDVDARSVAPASVDDVLEELEHECDARFRGPRVETLRHGRHVYFGHDPRVRIGAGRFRPGVDWRGEGGYIIAPDGKRYRLISDGEIEPAPEALIWKIVGAQGGGQKSQASGGGFNLRYEPTLREWVEAAQREGSRHDGMVRVVWRLTELGVPMDALMSLQPLFPQPESSFKQAVEGAFAKQRRDPAGGNNYTTTEQDADRLQFLAYDHSALASIPARQWVYAHYLIRSYVSVLGAPGGVGKTALAASVALAVASGKPLLQQAVHEPGPVIFANLEDPLEEMQRRIGAAMILHGLTQADIANRILLLSGRDQSLIIAERTRDGAIVSTPIVDRCIQEIKERRVVLFIVDPFVASHTLEENRNEQVNFAVKQWRRIAHETNCSILLSHHFRKGGTSGEQDSFRGASALIDAARAAVSLAPMQANERELFGLSEEAAHGLVRFDDAKLNLAPRPDKTNWYQLVSVQIPNGDNVQAVRVWAPPSKFEGLSLEIVNEILDELARGYDQDHRWGPTKNAKERFAGVAVTSVAQSHGVTIGEAQAAAIVRAWLESGLLRVDDYEKPNRTTAKGVWVVDAKRPSAGEAF